MKLPSGREIDVDSLLSAAALLGQKAFEYESMGDATEDIVDGLSETSSMLEGEETAFSRDDSRAIVEAVVDVARELCDLLYDAENKWEAEAKKKLLEEGMG